MRVRFYMTTQTLAPDTSRTISLSTSESTYFLSLSTYHFEHFPTKLAHQNFHVQLVLESPQVTKDKVKFQV